MRRREPLSIHAESDPLNDANVGLSGEILEGVVRRFPSVRAWNILRDCDCACSLCLLPVTTHEAEGAPNVIVRIPRLINGYRMRDKETEKETTVPLSA